MPSLLSSHVDGSIKLWVQAGEKYVCKDTLQDHTGTVYGLAMSKDNKLMSGGSDRTIKQWDMRRRVCARTLKGHTKGVRAVAVHQQTVVSGGADNHIRTWDLATGECTAVLKSKSRKVKGHSAEITCLCFDPTNPNQVVSGSLDQSVRVWDLESQKVETVFKVETGVNRFAVFRGLLIVAGKDGGVYVYDYVSGDKIGRFLGHEGGTYGVDVNDDTCATGGDDSLIKLWNTSTLRTCNQGTKPDSILRGHKGMVYSIILKDREMYSGSWDETIRIWDIATGLTTMIVNTDSWINDIIVVESLSFKATDSRADVLARTSAEAPPLPSDDSVPQLVSTMKSHNKSFENLSKDALLER